MSKEKKASKDSAKAETKAPKGVKKTPLDRSQKLVNGMTRGYIKLLRRVYDNRVSSFVEPIRDLVYEDENGETIHKARHRRHHYGASAALVRRGLENLDIIKVPHSFGSPTFFKLTEQGQEKIRPLLKKK